MDTGLIGPEISGPIYFNRLISVGFVDIERGVLYNINEERKPLKRGPNSNI